MEDRTKKIIIILAVVTAVASVVIYQRQVRPAQKYIRHSPYCEQNEDCVLYNCTSCGNRYWVEKEGLDGQICQKNIPGLVGCECVNGACKRQYEK